MSSAWAVIKEKLRIRGERLRVIVRGAQGLPIDDDAYQGLINPDDIRERTRVNPGEMMARSYLRLCADWFPKELGSWREVADELDHYAISLNEGEGRREAILMQRSKSEVVIPGQPMALPMVETQKQLNEPIKEQKGKKQ